MHERRYGVWLHGERVGTLNQRGDYTWFVFSETYLEDPGRSVLGLTFEEDLHARHASALRLPPWFSNLLPEGRLREWIARDRGVSSDREMELLAQVGRDLPGAVRVILENEPPEDLGEAVDVEGVENELSGHDSDSSGFRFSLAGVGLKFSMLKDGDRLTLPAHGQGGDWIVKLPDSLYVDVPRNEYAMMSLARHAGLDVPEIALVRASQLINLPDGAWKSVEPYAYAVRRFDRTSDGSLVHIEDFAQVRNFYPYGNGKYQGSFETIASLVYRRHDVRSLEEFARRMAFNILISNGDAHLKNWSLIYRDRRVPSLSPVYDLVSTVAYDETGHHDLGLKFGGTKSFDRVTMDAFSRIQEKFGAPTSLVDCVVDTIERTVEGWPKVAEILQGNEPLQRSISESIATRSRQLGHPG